MLFPPMASAKLPVMGITMATLFLFITDLNMQISRKKCCGEMHYAKKACFFQNLIQIFILGN